MAATTKRYRVYYKAGSTSASVLVQAQTRADARSKAKNMLPAGAKIINVDEVGRTP